MFTFGFLCFPTWYLFLVLWLPPWRSFLVPPGPLPKLGQTAAGDLIPMLSVRSYSETSGLVWLTQLGNHWQLMVISFFKSLLVWGIWVTGLSVMGAHTHCWPVTSELVAYPSLHNSVCGYAPWSATVRQVRPCYCVVVLVVCCPFS